MFLEQFLSLKNAFQDFPYSIFNFLGVIQNTQSSSIKSVSSRKSQDLYRSIEGFYIQEFCISEFIWQFCISDKGSVLILSKNLLTLPLLSFLAIFYFFNDFSFLDVPYCFTAFYFLITLTKFEIFFADLSLLRVSDGEEQTFYVFFNS